MSNKTSPWVNVYAGPMITDVVYRRNQLSESRVLTRRHLARVREGGIDALLIALFDLNCAADLMSEVEESEGQLAIATSAREVRDNAALGVISLLLVGVDDMVRGTPATLKAYHQLGMRVFSMSHNRRNLLTDGCGERTGAGLSFLGVDVVKELNRLNIIVDVSHMSEAGFYDVLDVSTAPVLATHSNARAVCGHPRNLTDDQLKLLAQKDGVVCLNFYRGYVSLDAVNASLDDLLAHIDHIANLIGSEHLGLGPDFMDAPPEVVGPSLQYVDPTGEHGLSVETYMQGPKGIEDNRRFRNVAEALRGLGWKDADIDGVMGGNFLRLLV